MELNEQEAAVLRKKVEELEAENDRLKSNTKELQDKLAIKLIQKKSIVSNEPGSILHEKKLKILEDETNELRKKLIEKERDCERLHAELSLTQKRSKAMQKSRYVSVGNRLTQKRVCVLDL